MAGLEVGAGGGQVGITHGIFRYLKGHTLVVRRPAFHVGKKVIIVHRSRYKNNKVHCRFSFNVTSAQFRG